MKSPFPGMDPYLEAYWSSFHGKLVNYAGEVLNELLPPDLTANTEERIGIESDSDDSNFLAPDVALTQAAGHRQPGTIEVAERFATYKLVAPAEAKQRYVEITTTDGSSLITVIEFISPSNKSSGLEKFLEKRAALLAGGVNFVEIDLTRAGSWQKLLLPQEAPPSAAAPYRYTIRLHQQPSVAYLEPMRLKNPLLKIPIPLRKNEPSVALPLQLLVDRSYQAGRFDRRIRYDEPVEPPLEQADAAWAKDLISPRTRSGS